MLASEELELKQPAVAPSAGSEPAPPTAEGESAAEQEVQAAHEAELETLRNGLEAAQKERDELLDKLQRSQAEFQNIRRRLEKEKSDIIRYSPSDTIQALLPVVDDFERAIATEGVPEDFKQGLELIHRRIFEVFQRAGLTAIEEHDTFDPNLHFAVDRAPASEDQSDHQILEVYQKGYRFKDRLLRASMVKVAVKE